MSHPRSLFPSIQKKCANKLNFWKSLENKFSLFRLFSILILIGILVHLFSVNKDIFIILLFVTFVYFNVCFWVHDHLKDVILKWNALIKRFENKDLRQNRKFSELQKKNNVFENLIKEVPKNHFYAADLDVAHHLFPLMDTCLFSNTSHKLFYLLMNGGLQKEPEEVIKQRVFVSELISKNSYFVSKMDYFQKYFMMKNHKLDLKNVISQKQNIEKNRKNSISILFLIFSLVSMIFWFSFFVPVIFQSFLTSQWENLLNPIVQYALIIFILNSFFQKTMSRLSDYESFLYFQNLLKTQKFTQGLSWVPAIQSKHLYFLNIILKYDNFRRNPLNWLLIHFIFPLDSFVFLYVEFFYKKNIELLENLKNIWIDFDLCLAFARFAQENSTSRFQNQFYINEFKVEEIRHPLIPVSFCESNHFILQQDKKLVLITGSNMAGKSTFLRTLGLNILLHNIGAPVFAKTFRVPFCQLLCAIRVQDSLEDGQSYFAAEVKRLSQIINHLKLKFDLFPLVLIDEIFKGTNNKERYIGSQSLIRYLSRKNELTFVTTHDIGLVELEKEESTIVNYHFSDTILNGQLFFDYKLKIGPCQSTNALFIMKIEGLPIE